MANPVRVQQYLGGIDYPATKQEIIDAAASEGAPPDIVSVLERIDDHEYDSPTELTEELGKYT